MKTSKTETQRQQLISLFDGLFNQNEKKVLEATLAVSKKGSAVRKLLEDVLTNDFDYKDSGGYLWNNLDTGVYSNQQVRALHKLVSENQEDILSVLETKEEKVTKLTKTAVRGMLVDWKKAVVGDKRVVCQIEQADGTFLNDLEWSAMLKTVETGNRIVASVYGWAKEAPLETTHIIEANASIQLS